MKTFYVIIDTQSKGVEEMKITDVRVRKVEGETRLKGVASITIDDAFAVHELRIIEGNEGLFVAMPSRKAADGTFRDIAHPINVETRKMVEEVVLAMLQELASNVITANTATNCFVFIKCFVAITRRLRGNNKWVLCL